MKKLVLAFAAILALSITSCGGNKTASSTEVDTTTVDTATVDTAAVDTAVVAE